MRSNLMALWVVHAAINNQLLDMNDPLARDIGYGNPFREPHRSCISKAEHRRRTKLRKMNKRRK